MESLKNMYEEFGICDAIYEFGQKTEEKLKTRFDAIDKNAEYNQLKVLHAMQKNRVCAFGKTFEYLIVIESIARNIVHFFSVVNDHSYCAFVRMFRPH